MDEDRSNGVFVEALRDSIGFKIKSYTPILLSEAYCLATNFEK